MSNEECIQDVSRAIHGLQDLDELIFGAAPAEWQMTYAERCAFSALVSRIKPVCAIEIGTAQGGSLAMLSRHATKVYSLDIDPTCRARLSHRFPNVEFITGDSHQTLTPLLAELQATGSEPSFVLIDGDHTYHSVKRDVEAMLKFVKARSLYMLMHDSFNPDCRQGIRDANWVGNPYVHYVELDFVPGNISDHPSFYRQMWAGLALAILLPTARQSDLIIQASHEALFRIVLAQSAHQSPLNKVRRQLRHLRKIWRGHAVERLKLPESVNQSG